MRHKMNKFDDNDDNRNYSLRGLEALSGKENKTRNERHTVVEAFIKSFPPRRNSQKTLILHRWMIVKAPEIQSLLKVTYQLVKNAARRRSNVVSKMRE